MTKPKGKITPLLLFVWKGFNPDYTSGLAFAVARNETDAQAQVHKVLGYDVYYWGTLTVYPLTKRIAFAVSGGG